MAGIVSYGVYVPYHRLSRDEMARATGTHSKGGEKAVANFDEDSATMAVEAVTNCLGDLNGKSVYGLYLASTTLPYKEKQTSAIVSTACDLDRQCFTADLTDSLRSGTLALMAAVDAVKAHPSKMVVVAASDCRLGPPGSGFEQDFGDGAVALLIGDSNIAVNIEAIYTHYDEFIGVWRTQSDSLTRSWEDRFVITEGYVRNMREALNRAMKMHDLTPKDFARVVLCGPDARSHLSLANSLGFDVKTQVQDPLFTTVGNTGSAFALMMLTAALDEAKPGDRILLANYGDGCDVFILGVTDQIERAKSRRGLKSQVALRKLLPTYEKYMRFRQLMTVEAERRRPPEVTSAVAVWRDRKEILALYGSKCKRCGTLQFPKQRVCAICQSKDEFEEAKLPRRGEIFTYCVDFLAPSVDPPTIKAIVDLDEEGRMFCLMTDSGEPKDIKIGMPVEMTFRMIHEAGGFCNYFWKCKPLRQ